jgi:hypothetical protein
MTPRQHAFLARQLIGACGGVEEAAQASRRSTSTLSRYQTPGADQFMPADVICSLERYCGQPIYSRALFEATQDVPAPENLFTEACEATESVSQLQREVRLAAADGVLTPAERQRLAAQHAEAERQLREVGQAIHQEAPAATPKDAG